MIQFDDKQVAEFYRHSYTTVDGLWFMKVEEKYGFDAALEIDNEVWKVVPKIQGRMLKSMRTRGNGIQALFECLVAKLTLDGFTFDTDRSPSGSNFRVIIKRCPWHDLMVKSGREYLSGRVGNVICNTEYSVWASEFGADIRFELQRQLCEGLDTCEMWFSC
jgi:hypothetical protein